MGVGVRTGYVVLAVALVLALPLSRTAQARGDSPESRRNSGGTLAIVVNRSNPVDNLSSVELRKIFLGARSHWRNGHRIALAMLDYGQPEREAVLRQIYRMDEDGYRDHFLKGVYRGEVFVSPKTLASPVVMRKFVFNAPGAIGYLRSSDVDGSVKVLRIDGHLPNDKDYSLQIDERPVK
jgi:ABC-type phosphate transport system substrate-binding protein